MFAERRVVRRMLIVRLQRQEVRITRLDERVRGQTSGSGVIQKVSKQFVSVLNDDVLLEMNQRKRLRNVVKIDLLGEISIFQAVIYCIDVILVFVKAVVGLARRGRGMHEEPVTPARS